MESWDYGNARLRARKAGLLGRDDYERLLGRPLDAVLGKLSRTVYGPDLEAALRRGGGLAALQGAVRARLSRQLGDLRRFYRGRPGRAVERLVQRWELQNVLTLLRGVAARIDPDTIADGLLPLGRLDAGARGALARQRDLGAVIDLLVAWDLPSAEVARALRAARPEARDAGTTAPLERAAIRAWAAAVGADPAVIEPLRSILGAEVDRWALQAALRARGARVGAPLEAGGRRPLGRLSAGALETATRSGDRAAAARALAADVPGDWRAALDRWIEDGDLAALDERLAAAVARRAVALFVRGDPLGAAIPTAYAFAVDAEARNLRIVGWGAAWGRPPEAVRPLLVLP